MLFLTATPTLSMVSSLTWVSTLESSGAISAASLELAGGVVVTRGLDDCLFIFPKPKFDTIAAEIDQQGIELSDVREWARYFFGLATDAETDKQGRVIIPQNLRDFAGLDGEAIVVGVPT